MNAKEKLKIKQKFNKIKTLMELYQRLFDRSINHRAYCEKIFGDKQEFQIAYSKLVDMEVRCVELDEKISMAIDQYEKLIIQ